MFPAAYKIYKTMAAQVALAVDDHKQLCTQELWDARVEVTQSFARDPAALWAEIGSFTNMQWTGDDPWQFNGAQFRSLPEYGIEEELVAVTEVLGSRSYTYVMKQGPFTNFTVTISAVSLAAALEEAAATASYEAEWAEWALRNAEASMRKERTDAETARLAALSAALAAKAAACEAAIAAAEAASDDDAAAHSAIARYTATGDLDAEQAAGVAESAREIFAALAAKLRT